MENKKGIICYDLAMCPKQMDMEKVIYIAENWNYLIYDSSEISRFNINKKPYMINPDEEMTKILVDISTEEGKKIYEEIIKKFNDNNNS